MVDNDFRFRILVTADLHGQLLAVDYATGKPSDHGLAVISKKIQDLKEKNTILIDLGDVLQGSPLMSFHERHRNLHPNPAAIAMNYLGYDYFVPGNHDFNYGQDYLSDFISQLHAKTLCGNIYRNNKLAFGIPYDLIQYPEGPKIAIVGITTHYIPMWEQKDHILDLDFPDAFGKAQSYVNEIKERHQPDLIVMAYHGGFERDLDTFEPYVEDTGENQGSRMLKEIKGIDVLLTSHQHRQIAKKVEATLVIQPEHSGKGFGLVECYFEKKEDNWIVKNASVEFITKGAEEPDPTLTKMLSKIEDATQAYLDEPIGVSKDDDLVITDQFQARLHKHKIVSLINQVQLEKTKAMISAASLGNSVTGFKKLITIRDVLSTYVYPNTIVVVEIDGKRLKMALEKNAEYFDWKDGKIVSNPKFSYPKKEHYNYDMFDGIEYTIDVAKPSGERIVSLTYQGHKIADRDRFTLALNNYRASGGGEFTMYRGLKVVKELDTDIAELMTEYIIKNKVIEVDDPKNVSVIASNNLKTG